MAHATPSDASVSFGSYATFWEPIPVAAAEPAVVQPDDAYAAFTALAEDGPAAPLTLSVEQTDVG
jgi:hypothetical protein